MQEHPIPPAGTRLRRRLPLAYFQVPTPPTSPPLVSSADVVSAPIDTFHVRTDYHLAAGFEAIAQIARPGSQVAAFIERQYPGGKSSNLTRADRQALQAIGSTFDALSIFLPHVWILKSVGTGAAIVAKSLRKEPVTASDMLDINSAYKGVVDLTIQPFLITPPAWVDAKPRPPAPASTPPLQEPVQSAPAAREIAKPQPPPQHTAIPLAPLVVEETLTLRQRARELVVLTQAPETSISRSPAMTPGQYVTIDRIPLLRQANGAGNLAWQMPPLHWYRTNMRVPDGDPGLFSVGDQDYVTIDGTVFAVRDISDTSLQVFNPTDLALPPLPVEALRGTWRFKTIPEHHVIDASAFERGKTWPQEVHADGFMRVNNKKYLMLHGKVIETDRATMVDEARIASSAQRIMERLPTADATGFIPWQNGQVIEGRLGYYATRYDARLGLIVDDVAGVPVPVHYDALKAQWKVGANSASTAWREALYSRGSDVDQQAYPALWEGASSPSRLLSESAESLQDWAEAKDFPFMHHWPRLAHALTKSFDRIASMSLSRPNRRSTTPFSQHFDMVHSIDSIRRCAYRLMPDIDVWESMSVVVRQEKAAAYTWDVYKGFHAIGLTMEMNLGIQALCSEMTELMLVQATRHMRSSIMPLLRKRSGVDTAFLEIQIKEQVPLGRTGRAHVSLMAFKSKEIMEAAFGAVSSAPSVAQSAYLPVLKEMTATEFRAFAYQNRREILLIDPWGPRKLIDFAMAGGVDAAMSELMLNLKEARFGDFTEHVGYTVQAFIPPRGGTARGTRLNSVEEQG